MPFSINPRRNSGRIIHLGISIVNIGISNYTVPRGTLLRYIQEKGPFRHEISATLTTCKQNPWLEVSHWWGGGVIWEPSELENGISLILGPTVPFWASGGTTKLPRSNFGAKSVPPLADLLVIYWVKKNEWVSCPSQNSSVWYLSRTIGTLV